ncbi:lysine 2,3-aminomutase [candidate division KSB1 bacterium]|nr:lysine 2,3-aminomutase [candidate division KSB1 bacterium]
METTNTAPNIRFLTISRPKYKAYTLQNFRLLPQIQKLSEEQKFAMEVVGHVFPFKTNNYVVEELINWDSVPNDPVFTLTFPQREMLTPPHFEKMAAVLRNSSSKHKIKEMANKIRWELNPHPAGQMEHNIPTLKGETLEGVQHKYKETVLFFPSQGQTCHAYCTFCFRWPQFVGISELKFAMRETECLIQYIRKHPEISDILFTGGDPLIMKTKTLATYIKALLEADLPCLQTIRIGTKALAFWPYKFSTDPDADELLALFTRVTQAGKHLAIMSHFTHPRELGTEAVQEAIFRIQETGAQIRTQSPVIAHINDQPEVWTEMWKEQVKLGCVPYYMFVMRNTGAQHYFGVPLVRAWKIFREAYRKVSGLSRTVRGPSMSTIPGKVQVLGVKEVKGERVFVLRFLQGRNPDWVMRPFFAKYDKKALWLDELKPAFGEKKFFFE